MSADQPATAAVAPSLLNAAKGEVIVVEIEPGRESFRVHADLLTYHSEYFRNALRGPWKEAQERVIKIDNVEPSTFKVGLFLHWLYFQCLPADYDNNAWNIIMNPGVSATDATNTTLAAIVLILVKAYVFGDRFLARQFQRETSREFSETLDYQGHGVTGRWQLIQYAFAHVPIDRPILQHIVDNHCRSWKPINDGEEDVAAQQNLPCNLLLRIMRTLSEMLSWGPESLDQRCYLEHATVEDKEHCGSTRTHMRYDEKMQNAHF